MCAPRQVVFFFFELVEEAALALKRMMEPSAATQIEKGDGGSTPLSQANVGQTQTLVAGNFERLERIGRGSFGNVYRGVNKRTGENVALKVVDLEYGEDDVDVIQREVATLASCRSRFVTEYIGSIVIPESAQLWIVMEYMAASVEDLIEAHGPLTESTCGVVMRGALNALEYLHSQKKIHRDMKAANLLVSASGFVKLAGALVSVPIRRREPRRMRCLVEDTRKFIILTDSANNVAAPSAPFTPSSRTPQTSA